MFIARTALLSICVSALADAHVTVWPRESNAGAYEKYIVRVPTEGKVATDSVELQIPDGIIVVSMASADAFSYELKRAGERVTSILWSKHIAPGEFTEFAFMARNPKESLEIEWKAVQRYADGSSTEWVGPVGDIHPASRTRVVAAPEGHSH